MTSDNTSSNTGRTSSTQPIDLFTSDEFQQWQADKLEAEANQHQNAEKTGSLVVQFVRSYEQHKADMPLDRWLVAEFQKHPRIWDSAADIEQTARDVVDTVTRHNANKTALYAHTDQGKSESSWVASHLEQGAKSAGVAHVGAYAANIEVTIEGANAAMAKTIFTKDGNLSQALNLDGFLAEQHHVDTFNLEAAAQGSPFRAKALVPDGTAYGKNSMDVGIYGADGKLVRRYQAKYGQHADATQALWDKGDYRGQQKLVPADQVGQIKGATDRLQHEGVESKPLTKAQAKALQEKAQQQGEAQQYDWNEVSRGEISKQISKQALISAGMTAGFHGARVLGRRVWNGLTGQNNQPLSADLQDFFASSVKSGAHTGVQVAVSGAMVVAAKSGWLGAVLRNTPVRNVTAMVQLGMENAKTMAKFASGELTGPEALDTMGKSTTTMGISLAAAGAGAAQGAAWGAVLGPAGAFVGGLVGGVVGGMAGSNVGGLVYEGSKSLVKTGLSVAKSTASAVYSGAKSVVSGVASGVKSAGRAIASLFSW